MMVLMRVAYIENLMFIKIKPITLEYQQHQLQQFELHVSIFTAFNCEEGGNQGCLLADEYFIRNIESDVI